MKKMKSGLLVLSLFLVIGGIASAMPAGSGGGVIIRPPTSTVDSIKQ